jgi:hypothetical protein
LDGSLDSLDNVRQSFLVGKTTSIMQHYFVAAMVLAQSLGRG